MSGPDVDTIHPGPGWDALSSSPDSKTAVAFFLFSAVIHCLLSMSIWSMIQLKKEINTGLLASSFRPYAVYLAWGLLHPIKEFYI